MKRTPGIWEARKGDTFHRDRPWGVVVPISREACEEVDGDDSMYGNRTEVIAEVCPAPDGQDEADARLMSAVPELLEAVIIAEVCLESLGEPFESDSAVQCALSALRAAVNKAQGE